MEEGRDHGCTSAHWITRACAVTGMVLAALVFHWPSVVTGFDTVLADPGDSVNFVVLMEHWYDVFRGRAAWRSPPMFFPVKDTLLYSDSLFGFSLFYAPLRALGARPFQALNIECFFLTIAAMSSLYALLRTSLRVNVPAALMGAIFYGITYPRFGQLGHIQLMYSWPLPLILLLLFFCVQHTRSLSRTRVLCLLSIAGALQVLLVVTIFSFAFFLTLLIGAALIVGTLFRPLRLALLSFLGRHALPLLGASLLTAILFAPVYQLYAPFIQSSGGFKWEEALRFIPTVDALTWMGTQNLVWGWWYATYPEGIIGQRWAEGRIGVGMVAMFAAFAGVVCLVRDLSTRRGRSLPQLLTVSLLIGGVLLAVLAVRVGDASLWYYVFHYLPGGSGIRAISRVFLFLTLPMAIAIAYATHVAISAIYQHSFSVIEGSGPHAPSVAVAQHGVVGNPLAASLMLFAISLACLAEQLGDPATYSGSKIEDQARDIASRTPADCGGFIAVPTVNHAFYTSTSFTPTTFDAQRYLAANPNLAVPAKGAWDHFTSWSFLHAYFPGQDRLPSSEAQFDAVGYLAMNPDVAAVVPTEDAWEHYVRYGRHERRALSPTHRALNGVYARVSMLAAIFSGVPTLTGYSGWEPEGWNLGDVFHPDIGQFAQQWGARHNVRGRICGVQIDLS